jgi:two-component system chemotaxis response regulator CheY
MKRILVADDSPATRSLVAAALLGMETVEVQRVSTGLEALKVLTESQIDLVLTDVHMPEINGIELVRMIKQGGRTRETPVVMMSTESSDADRDRGIASGADDFLAKPFTAMELRAVLDKHLNVAKVDSVADKVAD